MLIILPQQEAGACMVWGVRLKIGTMIDVLATKYWLSRITFDCLAVCSVALHNDGSVLWLDENIH